MRSRTYIDFAGLKFTGAGYAGVVRSMRDYAWMATSKGDYMRDVAKRVAKLTGGRTQLATHAPKAFLDSLVEANFLQEVVQPEPAALAAKRSVI